MMGPMGMPMGMPMDMSYDQFIGAAPTDERQYQGYYQGPEEQNLGAPLAPYMDDEQMYQGFYQGAEEQSLGAPLAPYMDNEQQYQGIDQQMVGGPLEDLLHVRI